MSVDMSQFHEVFFEESFEGLDDMEAGLLDLNIGEPDVETINTIFRAAHSIKGGSGTFGFTAIASFTHVLETLLDEMRAGQRNVCQKSVDLLLQSVDCLRNMLSATRDEAELDTADINELQTALETLLAEEASDVTIDENVADVDSERQEIIKQWSIRFIPHENMFLTGNDPLRLITELSGLGEIEVIVDDSKLPGFDTLDYESSFLSWDITVKGNIEEEKITEIFDWVEGDCDLELKKMLDENAVSDATSMKEKSDLQLDEKNDIKASEITQPVAEVAKNEQRSGTDRRVAKERRSNSESTSIRVGIEKIDTLINMVGELVITQSMLSQFGAEETFDQADIERLKDGLDLLERNTREIQENVLQIRMLPISFSFNRFPRLVRDLSNTLNKKIELKISGEQTELDKTVMEKIGDPMVHLVRNSLDHGIEMPEDRVKAGKPETGVIHLNAFHEGGNIVIEIIDDGAGLNKERILAKAREKGIVGENEILPDDKINELIFMPAFSTAQEVSDVSGRGVGMDVVRRNIKDLGGVVEIKSKEGVGSTFRIRLPLTLAILDGQLVQVGEQTYIIPLVSIVESLQAEGNNINSLPGKGDVYRLRDEYIPIVRLHEVFDVEAKHNKLTDGLLVVVEADGQKAAIFVDDLLGQQQVVIKSLETNYQRVDGVSGATILGNGTVALILDMSSTLQLPILSDTKSKPHSLPVNSEAA